MPFDAKNYPIINDDSASMRHAFPPEFKRGGTPRDYSVQPREMFLPPSGMTILSANDRKAYIEEQDRESSSLEHLFLGPNLDKPKFVNLDQNGHGYCWAYSTGHAIMMDRLKSNQPMVRLNPHATAAIIKGGRDEGGWCGLSAKFAREIGYAEEGTASGQWPVHSRSLSYDTAELRLAMAKRKVTEEWVDLALAPYDQNLTWDQLATAVVLNQSGPVDFNWWGHSVCAVRIVIVDGEECLLILNSWKGWGRFGLGILQGTRKRPDGALTIRQTTAS
jgi:hypothetical protein